METVKHGKEFVRKYAPKYCIKHFAHNEISGNLTVRKALSFCLVSLK